MNKFGRKIKKKDLSKKNLGNKSIFLTKAPEAKTTTPSYDKE